MKPDGYHITRIVVSKSGRYSHLYLMDMDVPQKGKSPYGWTKDFDKAWVFPRLTQASSRRELVHEAEPNERTCCISTHRKPFQK